MIPDKIYFGYDEGTHLESYCLEKKGKCQLEYIRKDALLNWLKEHINDYLVHGRDIDLMFDDIKNAF